MMNLRPIIDSWNMIEKYKIQTAGRSDRWCDGAPCILVSDSEFERLLASVVNKKYIMNLIVK